MCGIVGFVDLARRCTKHEAVDQIRGMAMRLAHRGPDSAGEWADEAMGVGFGFRRLAIVDLTAAGAQPMISASGYSILVYNGEVYNPEDLRPQLQKRGIRFRGHC